MNKTFIFEAKGVANPCSNHIKVITSKFGEFFNIKRHHFSDFTFIDKKKYKVIIIIKERK